MKSCVKNLQLAGMTALLAALVVLLPLQAGAFGQAAADRAKDQKPPEAPPVPLPEAPPLPVPEAPTKEEGVREQEDTSDKPTIISLEEMLAVALKYNPDIRAADARLRAAEADLDRTRLEVVQKIIAFRQAWQAQRIAVLSAQGEWRRMEKLQRLSKMGPVPRHSLEGAQVTKYKLAAARAKLAEIEAELPFLLGKAADHAAAQGDPLKQKAEAVLDAARRTFAVQLVEYEAKKSHPEHVYRWSRRWMDAQRALSETRAERAAAIEDHLTRMEQLLKVTERQYEVGTASAAAFRAFQFYVAEAQLWLAQTKN
jgi:hypothetical protein